MNIRKRAWLLIFMSASAYGCPTIIGDFRCQDGDRSYTISFAGGDEENSINVDGAEWILDNVARPITDDPTFRNASETMSCDDSAIRSHIVGEFLDGEKQIGRIDSTLEYALINNTLIESTYGKMITASREIPINERVPCDRISN